MSKNYTNSRGTGAEGRKKLQQTPRLKSNIFYNNNGGETTFYIYMPHTPTEREGQEPKQKNNNG